jgi:subtilisin family serine protease
VLIAVIDTGIDASHPDLRGKVVGESRAQGTGGDETRVVSGRGLAADDSGHGTHVAGIAAAVTDNGIGIAGAAPDARLWAVKVLFAVPGHVEQGTPDDLAAAIDYVSDAVAPAWKGPVVMSISVGAADSDSSPADQGWSQPAVVLAALDHAYSRGIGIAVAAGNSGNALASGFAEATRDAMVSGALDSNGRVAPYSPTSGVNVFAAGGTDNGATHYVGSGIISTWPPTAKGDYAWLAGTSMAAPEVAAALALLMSTGLSNQAAYDRIVATEDSAHRLHVDTALGASGGCGTTPPAPPAAAAPVARPGAPVAAPRTAVRSAAPLVGLARPSPTAMVVTVPAPAPARVASPSSRMESGTRVPVAIAAGTGGLGLTMVGSMVARALARRRRLPGSPPATG